MSHLDPEATIAARPTGTVTFLFSDVEGSTQRWERSREAMSAALQRHDALLQTVIEGHGGYVFKRVGDAFCAAFTRPPDAAEAAIDAQRMLAAEDFTAVDGLRVRMALHAGQSEERDGDYFGAAVNRVARLLAIGHGAQVLVSGVTAELIGDELPAGCSLRDLGMHRLKDLGQPEHTFALVAPDLPAEFPALRSLEGVPNNLPVQLTSFVGREAELAAVKTLLQSDRLVTLVGTGGSGKTRCALQIAAESLDTFADGAWQVELAPIAEASLAAAAIGEALNLQLAPHKPALDSIVAYCRRKKLLLVIDNCEHLLDEVRKIITAILQQCPDARILATSREGLNLPGERAFRMPSLPVPPVRAGLAADDALKFAAAALFAARAASADSRFAVTDENAAVVAEICRRLDGIPFAIELAAARVKVLSPKQLSQKLDERFRLLTGGNPMALPRQQTMRALIDWSYDLLSDAERVLFRKLAIFAGGFTLEIATAACGDETLDELAILDLLASLVDKSLVSVDASGDVTRYSLLESTRQYAREKLVESGEYPAAVRAHAAAMLAFVERLEANHPGDHEWNAQAEPELDNWRTALDWAFGEGGDVLLGQRLAATLGRTWSNFAPSEGRRRIGTAIEKIDAATSPELVADLHLADAQMCGVLGLHKTCHDAAVVALERYRALDNRLGIAKAQRHAGRALVFGGQTAAGEAQLREALETFRACGERPLTGAALENLAIARNFEGAIVEARELFGEALAIFKAEGMDRLGAAVANNVAESEFKSGNVEEALRLINDALATYGVTVTAYRPALMLSNASGYLIALRRYGEARARAREGLAMARALSYDVVLLWTLQHLAAVAALRPNEGAPQKLADVRRAASVLGYTDAALEAVAVQREFTELREYEEVVSELRRALGPEETAQLMAGAATWSEDQAVAEALMV